MFVTNIRVEPVSFNVDQFISLDYLVDPSYDLISDISLEEITSYIERLLLGVEVTPFFIGNNPELNGKCEVVDGRKRFLMLKKYVRGDFALTHCSIINGLSQRAFSDLPRSFKRRIEGIPLTVYEIYHSGFGIDNYNMVCRLVRNEK